MTESSSTALPMAPLVLRGVTFDPPLFCAPMAGITHSAFRRLLAGFGGYGALFTEMLSAKMLLNEDMQRSPWVKRRPEEGKVIYQLLVTDTERLPEILDRLTPLHPDGLDLNCACPVHTVRRQGGGSDLFEDPERLRHILRVMRNHFSGPLTVKIRLGRQSETWRETLCERLNLFEDEGVDALTLQPRFTEEPRNRAARHTLYPELCAETRLPIIANGDITGPDVVRDHAPLFSPTAGLMIGRMAAACPWIFALWHNSDLVVNPTEIWERLCDYIAEDFIPRKGLVALKIFAPYLACNFAFGHTFSSTIQNAVDFQSAREKGAKFLATSPARLKKITFGGL